MPPALDYIVTNVLRCFTMVIFGNRFGFNVKGGVDQGMPIIVSRVAAGMPADTCIPRLNEGDQVLYINGRDVTQHKHEQVN